MITSEKFIEKLSLTNILTEKKLKIIKEIKTYSPKEIVKLYKIFEENIKNQKKIIKIYNLKKELLFENFKRKAEKLLNKKKKIS